MCLLTHSPLSTNVCSWKYISKEDIRGHQLWEILSKSIISNVVYCIVGKTYPNQCFCNLQAVVSSSLDDFAAWLSSRAHLNLFYLLTNKRFQCVWALHSFYSSLYCINHWPVVFMSWVERLGRTLSETVDVGEEGDCGAAVHEEKSAICSKICNRANSYHLHLQCILSKIKPIIISTDKINRPSSSDDTLLSPHSVLISFKMRLSRLLTLGSRFSAWVLVGNFLFGGKSMPFSTANSSSSYNNKTHYENCQRPRALYKSFPIKYLSGDKYLLQ